MCLFPSRADQEMTASFRIPGGGPPPKLSPSKLSPGKLPAPTTCHQPVGPLSILCPWSPPDHHQAMLSPLPAVMSGVRSCIEKREDQQRASGARAESAAQNSNKCWHMRLLRRVDVLTHCRSRLLRQTVFLKLPLDILLSFCRFSAQDQSQLFCAFRILLNDKCVYRLCLFCLNSPTHQTPLSCQLEPIVLLTSALRLLVKSV